MNHNKDLDCSPWHTLCPPEMDVPSSSRSDGKMLTLLRMREINARVNSSVDRQLRGHRLRQLTFPSLLYEKGVLWPSLEPPRLVCMRLHHKGSTKALAIGTVRGDVALYTFNPEEAPVCVPNVCHEHKTIQDMMFGDDVQALITSAGDGLCRIWDLERCELVEEVDVQSPKSRLHYCGKSKSLAVAARKKGVLLIDLRTGFTEERLMQAEGASGVKWSRSTPLALHVSKEDGILATYDRRMLHRPLIQSRSTHTLNRDLEELVESVDGSFIYAASPDGITVFDSLSLQVISHIKLYQKLWQESRLNLLFRDASKRMQRHFCVMEEGDSTVAALPLYSNLHLINLDRTRLNGSPYLLRTLCSGPEQVSVCTFDSDRQELLSASSTVIRWSVEDSDEGRSVARVRADRDDWSD